MSPIRLVVSIKIFKFNWFDISIHCATIPGVMENLNDIEELISRSLCRDQHRLFQRLKSARTGKTPSGQAIKNKANYLKTLVKHATESAQAYEKRAQTIPPRMNYDDNLPITAKRAEIVKTIQDHPVVIISGETGSGKTTQIPKFCLEAGRGRSGLIGCTQPRRIAAMNVAKRIAQELGQPLGESVGYKIRFDDHTAPNAHIKLMTDGILLAETQTDRFLNQYDTIIVDEAHERSLNIDFTLGILRRLVKTRKNLKLIITSATIDTEKFSKAFDGAPIIEVSGRMYPVELRYRPITGPKGEKLPQDDQGFVEAAVEATENILAQSRQGDILIFMPTEQDIGETLELLRGRNYPGITALPLFARLSAKEQSKVFSRQPGRKIIVSTNVAETSLTIPGIKYVVDSGLARIPSYSPRTRTTALPVSPISQSSANQRMGRCGRVENGICIRLYDEDDFNGRPFFTAPEILRSNLAEVILRMISLRLGDVSTFPFIDPPAAKSIKDGFDTLVELGAIQTKPIKGKAKGKKQYRLTEMGRLMARLPVDPKLSRILIEAEKNGCLREAVTIVTALSLADIRQRPADKAQAADQQHAQFRDPTSDFITLLNIWDAVKNAEKDLKSRSKVRDFCISRYLSYKRYREWLDIHRQISRMVKDHGLDADKYPLPAVEAPPAKGAPKKGGKGKGPKGKAAKQAPPQTSGFSPLYTALHKSLLAGYLAHIAHKKEKNTYTAAKGQQAMIFPGSGLFDKAGTWVVAAEYVKTSQLFARGVANIDPLWLEELGKDLVSRTHADPHWSKKQGQVMAKEQVTLFGLIIVSDRKVAYGKINPQESSEIFIRQALVEGEVMRPLPFMEHNRSLMDQVEELEHKTRKRDIMASEEDLFLFYQSRLPQPFYDIRTFNRFVRDQGGDDFLHMDLETLQKARVEEAELALYPDVLETHRGEFALSYDFNPGADTDGVTLKVPAHQAAQVPKAALDHLVPGLFKEKVEGLIKNLPKSFRVKLMPVQKTAAFIAENLKPRQDMALFSQLSAFIREHYNLVIPATAWSDDKLADHLKFRISIRDDKDREIKAMRDLSILGEFPTHRAPKTKGAFEDACAKYERTGITDWDFGELVPGLKITEKSGFSQTVFPALKVEKEGIALRLFKSEPQAKESHLAGVLALYQKTRPEEFKALKKDIRAKARLRQIAPYFKETQDFQARIFHCLCRAFFARDIRSRDEFEAHFQKVRPDLYNRTQTGLTAIVGLGEEYAQCFSQLQSLGLKFQNLPQASAILNQLYQELKNLIPSHFLDIYELDRMADLARYVTCLRTRARRGVDNPGKENAKGEPVRLYQRKLNHQLESLSDTSSAEKTRRVEDFFWLLEEFKISIFAPELKTRVKVSAKRLDKELVTLSTMI